MLTGTNCCASADSTAIAAQAEIAIVFFIIMSSKIGRPLSIRRASQGLRRAIPLRYRPHTNFLLQPRSASWNNRNRHRVLEDDRCFRGDAVIGGNEHIRDVLVDMDSYGKRTQHDGDTLDKRSSNRTPRG